MARYAYIRIDDQDKDPARQAMLLDTIGGFDKIYVDDLRIRKDDLHEDRAEAGTEKKLKLSRALASLIKSDVLYVASADRVCESISGFIEIVGTIKAAGADFCCLDISFDSRSPASELALRVLETLHGIETEAMSRKKKSGIERARANGRRVGRPPVSIPAGFRVICRKWEEGKITGAEAISMSGMKSTSFYKKASELGFKKPAGKDHCK